MIPSEDLLNQELEYIKRGEADGGHWTIQAYFPGPSLIMVNLTTGERVSFGSDSVMSDEFDPVEGGERRNPFHVTTRKSHGY